MSRIACVLCCAAFVVGGLLLVRPVSSQTSLAEIQGVSKAQAELASERLGEAEHSAEERIQEVLSKPLKTPLEFQELPLSEVLNIIEEEYDIPIMIDAAAFNEVVVSPETEISVSFRDITLRSALSLMFRQPDIEDLTYVIDQEVLIITSADRANASLTTIVYRVDDLETVAQAGYTSLIDVITRCVEKHTWSRNKTGDGEIEMLQPGIMVVSQTPDVHANLASFLEEVRNVRGQIRNNAKEANGGSVTTRGFWIMQRAGQLTKEDQQTIMRSIVDSVEWGDQDNDSVWIRPVGNHLLVRHRREVLAQVEKVIGQMGMSPTIRGGTFGGGGF